MAIEEAIEEDRVGFPALADWEAQGIVHAVWGWEDIDMTELVMVRGGCVDDKIWMGGVGNAWVDV